MHFSLGELVVVMLYGLGAVYFMSAIRVRELAIRAVTGASANEDFQLLDQTVHIQRVSMSRDASGRWRIWRQYRFDYSYDGVQREQGLVVMLGKQLETIVMAERQRTLH